DGRRRRRDRPGRSHQLPGRRAYRGSGGMSGVGQDSDPDPVSVRIGILTYNPRCGMALRVYNTLTRQKEPFETVQPGKVGMYLCGPTVYKPSHVGHMVGPVIFDMVKRYLAYLGYQVTFVVNITDIDDKVIAEAARQKRDWKELAESVTADYLQN